MIVYLLVTALSLLLAQGVRSDTAARAGRSSSSGGTTSGVSRRVPARGNGISRRRALSDLCLWLLFAVLFIPEALRVNTGNDYAKYVDFFHNIGSSAYGYVATEFGFNAVVKLIYTLSGFENYLLVFAVFAALTVLFFLLAMKEQAEDFPFSFFLFMMFGYYFQSYNTVRYYFVLSLVLWACRFLLDGRYAYFVLTVLAAAAFHKSVLAVLVLYPLALLPWKRWMLVLMTAAGAGIYLTRGFWLRAAVRLYPSYEGTEFLTGVTVSWSNVARCVLILAAAYYVRRRLLRGSDGAAAAGPVPLTEEAMRLRRSRFYVFCELEALWLYVFCSFIPFVSRIAYYLTITQIFLLPEIVRCIPGKTDEAGHRAASAPEPAGICRRAGDASDARSGALSGLSRRFMQLVQDRRRLAKLVIVLAAVFYFVMLLRKMPDETIKILPYRSFLFDEMPAIWSDVNR